MAALNVLYVDDDPDIREIAVLSLSLDSGMTVESAESGVHALQVLEGGLRPDVILMDVMMPDLDGPGALVKIRENPELAHIPVIFITARVLPNEQARFMQLGAKAVIVKPFDPMGLPGKVRDILAQ